MVRSNICTNNADIFRAKQHHAVTYLMLLAVLRLCELPDQKAVRRLTEVEEQVLPDLWPVGQGHRGILLKGTLGLGLIRWFVVGGICISEVVCPYCGCYQRSIYRYH